MQVSGRKDVQLNLRLSADVNEALESIANDAETDRTDVVRRALALLMVAHQAKREGRHLGVVDDASKLDTEIVGVI